MTVNEFMQKSGISPHLAGYAELETLLEESIKHPEKNMKNLLKVIQHDVDDKGRNIRYAISKGYPIMDKRLKKQIFQDAEKITALRYIRTVSNAIKNKYI